VILHPEFREDLQFWSKTDPDTEVRVLDLLQAILLDPLNGPGKPEALQHALAGCWSRRITQEHRLVYRVRDEAIDFLQARYHY
jgi:toxin YoeB